MIPIAQIIQWRTTAPWPDNMQVEENLNLKLQENSFLDDIGPLLSNELKRTHASPLITENANRLSTEGWNLIDAAEEIKKNILAHLPK